MRFTTLSLSAMAAVALAQADVADEAFEKLLANSELQLTQAEKEAFHARFLAAAGDQDNAFFDDELAMYDMFEMERPAVYESYLKKLDNATWTPGMNDRFTGLSQREYLALQGFKASEKAIAESFSNPRSRGWNPDTPAFVSRRKHEVAPGDLPENFHLKDKWPQCESVTAIRDQSACGSCWAVSTAAAYSDRLCVASDGKFNKPISSQFMTSCFEQSGNGCFGGDPASAWYELHNRGAPTGGEYQRTNTGETCYPYAIAPSGAQLFKSDMYTSTPPPTFGAMVTPSCKKECTDTEYKLSMADDMRKISAAKVYRLEGIDSIKYEIFHHGSVVTGFFVSEDIKYYKKGVYTPSVKYGNGGHAVRIVGWGKEDGKDYWLISNSWGTKFGLDGYIKYEMGFSEMEGYVHVADVSSTDGANHSIFLA